MGIRLEWSVDRTYLCGFNPVVMEYFDLFGIPVSLEVDKASLRTKYLSLSRRFHPDHNAGGDQDAVLEHAARLNKAYKTLGDEDLRLGYVLAQKGVLETDEKYALPPEFLMEMMEMNELLEEGSRRDAVMTEAAAVEERIYAPVRTIIAGYDESTMSAADLLALKDYYFKKKYLRRLTGQTEQKL
jgi:molecular chaperone HscB